MFLFFQCALAQNYILDNTFGTNGRVINPSIRIGSSIQLQSDGKIVSCYRSSYSISGNVHLVRFKIDGSIDTTFGTNGFVNTIVVNQIGGVNMMKLQSDGKILITGFSSSNGTTDASYFNFCTARYNTDGTIDTTFGTNGYAITDLQFLSTDQADAIEIQNDGKILVGGQTSNSSAVNHSIDFALVRYSSNGTIDTSFGTNGKFIYNFGTDTVPNSSGYSEEHIGTIKINTLGEILVGGYTTVNESISNYYEFAFIKLNPNGTLNTNFGTNGQKVVDFGNLDFFYDMQLTSDDKIIAVGTKSYTTASVDYSNIVMVKLLVDGSYDTSFGSNGKVITNKDSSTIDDSAWGLVIQSDGKIICVGATQSITSSIDSIFLMIRFNADGSIDTTFNGNGYLTDDFNNQNDLGVAILIQSDGKILCSGSSNSNIGCFSRYIIAPLSTTNFDSNNNITISPNPFTDSLTINTKDINLSMATIELYDISGRKISNFSTDNTTNFTFSINSNLSKGNYFLKITDQQTTKTFKLLKE